MHEPTGIHEFASTGFVIQLPQDLHVGPHLLATGRCGWELLEGELRLRLMSNGGFLRADAVQCFEALQCLFGDDDDQSTIQLPDSELPVRDLAEDLRTICFESFWPHAQAAVQSSSDICHLITLCLGARKKTQLHPTAKLGWNLVRKRLAASSFVV